ncbi:MAG: hypothetical protein HPY66_0715 [Firmicutes bacterium]|nr:hypothetical protein [Bacillota bacterium]MDI6705649.1 hypothetical protein [Bacillota bacterium]
MKVINMPNEIGYSSSHPVKKDLIIKEKYKLLTIGVDNGVTIAPCVMESETLFYVVEGRGEINDYGREGSTDYKNTLTIKSGDIIVVPPKTIRSIAAYERMSLLAVQIH